MGDVAAFCPLKRNGNVLISNSIECVDKNLDVTGTFISDAFKEAMEGIVRITKQSDEPINLVCIGHQSYLKPNVYPFPRKYPTPTIYEKDDEIYKDTDYYHRTLDIVFKDDNFSFENIKSKNPQASYMDPRNEIEYSDFSVRNNNLDEAIKIIDSINYSSNKDTYVPINKYLVKRAYYSNDWYIVDTVKGVVGEYLENDHRAKEEFEEYMNEITKDNNQKILRK